MNHREIRFNILHNLYQKHYSDQLKHPQMTDMIIQDSDLGNLDRNLVYGDIVYLVDSGLATGEYVLGHNMMNITKMAKEVSCFTIYICKPMILYFCSSLL